MKHLKNKKTLLFGGILLIGVTALGATIAFNQDSATLENWFSAGNMTVTATDSFASPNNWKPCDSATKEVTFKNNSNAPVNVRVKINEYWRDAADTRNLPLEKDGVSLVEWQRDSRWRTPSPAAPDGYYYYYTRLDPGRSTDPLFRNNNITLSCDANFGANNVCTETDSGVVCSKQNDIYEGAKYHIKITAEFVQASAADMVFGSVRLAEGTSVNAALKQLAGNSSATSSSEDNTVKSISVVDRLPSGIDIEGGPKVNIGKTESEPIYAYIDDDKNIYIHANGKTLIANTLSYEMFYKFQAVTSLDLTERFYTGDAKWMNHMFEDMKSLTTLTLPESFDTQNVRNMDHMFEDMISLTTLTLPESFDTSSAIHMEGMFSGLTSLTSLTFPSIFDTSSAQYMQDMFWGMDSIRTINLPPYLTAKSAKNVSRMFSHMLNLTSLTLPDGFTAPVATDMTGMFSLLEKVTSLTLPDSFDTSSAIYMDEMFARLYRLGSLTLPNSFNTSNVTSMQRMFYSLSSSASGQLRKLTLPPSFVVNSGANTGSIFDYVSSNLALNYDADPSVKALWQGPLYRP